MKHVNDVQEDVFVTGYRTGRSNFGWLISFEDGSPAGVMELGVPPKARHVVYTQEIARESNGMAFLKAPIACRVKHRHRLRSGYLRFASFVAFL